MYFISSLLITQVVWIVIADIADREININVSVNYVISS